jgi:phosphatidylinositol alpha-1,6-mannosyltransferase
VADRRRLLIVTNDFPPRQGGIQSMIFELARRLPADQIAVYCSDFPGSAAFDAGLDFPVRRHPGGLLIPTPSAARRIVESAGNWGSTRIWFGAAAPLGLLAPALRRHGVQRQVASTHGHEVGWAKLPVARQALRRIGNSVDVITYLAPYTRRRLEPALGPHPLMCHLSPGVDTSTFSPDADGSEIRRRYGLGTRPVIVCVSRLVPRKGQDNLIAALPAINAAIGVKAVLLLVGGGPYRRQLQQDAERLGVQHDVVFTGPVDVGELAAHYAAGDVFAMPCRTRRAGLDVEGLGIVFLEASAVGLPVVAGDSGGAPDAVRDGDTGFVLDGRDVGAITDRLTLLLREGDRAAAMGAAGRSWVQTSWQWDSSAAVLAEALQL